MVYIYSIFHLKQINQFLIRLSFKFDFIIFLFRLPLYIPYANFYYIIYKPIRRLIESFDAWIGSPEFLWSENMISQKFIQKLIYLILNGIIAPLLFLFLNGCEIKEENAQRLPNIIFILVDDMRWDQLGSTGHPFAKTPNIDRIGKEGVTFNNAFVCTPLCSPSRASFLTGQFPHKHRIINNDRNGLSFISHKLVTFPQLLRRVGYKTAFIGKWHMGDDDSRRPGFDHWISFRAQGIFIDPVVNTNGQRSQYTGYMTDLLNQWSVDFLNQKHDKPFLLYLSHKAVHAPFIPADRHKNQYTDHSYLPPTKSIDDLKGKPAINRKLPPVDVLQIPGATPEPAEPRYGRGSA